KICSAAPTRRPRRSRLPLDAHPARGPTRTDGDAPLPESLQELIEALGPSQDVAEGAGFEPAIEVPLYTPSRRAPSTPPPPLRNAENRTRACPDRKRRSLTEPAAAMQPERAPRRNFIAADSGPP